MAEHKHAALLRAIADGEQIQFLYGSLWFDGGADAALCQIGENVIQQDWRIKPKMLNINGKEFPEPLREIKGEMSVFWPNYAGGWVSPLHTRGRTSTPRCNSERYT